MSRWDRTLFTTPSVYYYPYHTSCGVDEMGKPAKDLVERVGGMGRPPGRIKNDTFQKWTVLGPRADFDFRNLIRPPDPATYPTYFEIQGPRSDFENRVLL